MTDLHLAQINIARMKAPLDDPRMAGFVARLDDVNALADRSPGFVWRLQTPAGNATDLRPFPDARLIVNMSVWESLEHLRQYVYRTGHADVLRQRQAWFEKLATPTTALWWVPAGQRPSVDEGQRRLAHLEAEGPTPFAFTFGHSFPAEAAQAPGAGAAGFAAHSPAS
jgi:hypothetical protein